MRKILIDDLRDIKADVVCRKASDAYKILAKESFDVYYFDHDLGSTKPGTSGYDVLNWAIENGHIPIGSIVQMVTSNPVGAKNMADAMTYNGFEQLGNTFKRLI